MGAFSDVMNAPADYLKVENVPVVCEVWMETYSSLFANKGINFEDEIVLRGGGCETPVSH